MGDKCAIQVAFCVGCHYDKKAFDYLQTAWFGFYDYVLGVSCVQKMTPNFLEHDAIVAKNNPELMICDQIPKAWTLSNDFSMMVVKGLGFKSMEEYHSASEVVSNFHNIKRPLFLLSAKDDNFFGEKCIPIDKCKNDIMIGVTKTGGHVLYFSGWLIPDAWWCTPAFEYLNFFRNSRDTTF